MKKIQESIASEIAKDVYAINERSKSDRSKLFCTICSFAISTFSDSQSLKENGCCETCRTKFVEPRMKKWKSGWRPSKKEVNEFVENFSMLPNSFEIK